MAQSYFKEPFEAFSVAMDFAPALPTGASLSSCVVTVQDQLDGTDVTATLLLSGTATIVGTQAQVKIQNGTAKHIYNVRFRATLNTGEFLEEDATLSVQQDGV